MSVPSSETQRQSGIHFFFQTNINHDVKGTYHIKDGCKDIFDKIHGFMIKFNRYVGDLMPLCKISCQ